MFLRSAASNLQATGSHSPIQLHLRPAPLAFQLRRSFARRVSATTGCLHAQLEYTSSTVALSTLKASARIPQTLTEKIVQRHCLGLPKEQSVKPPRLCYPVSL